MSSETLDLIEEALKAIGDPVFYGVAAKLPKSSPWNYTVFSRSATSSGQNRTGYTDLFEVAVVRESYVPDGVLFDVVDAMEAIPGMRLSRSSSVEYRYDVKPGTSDAVEMMVVRFAKARRRP